MAKVRPMTEYVSREIAPVSFTAVLAAIFGALALHCWPSPGVYGVFSYQGLAAQAGNGHPDWPLERTPAMFFC